ncbi:MAG: DsrE family protein [Desulfobacca sp.]|uniref:DsrE family protein n=1 Tax=Desulfobacca sp. TaxID=2067990 RepID=UPI00404AB413
MANLLFIVTKGFDNAGLAVRAIQFASIAAENGHHVEIFLIEDGVYWSQLGMSSGVYSVTGDHMQTFVDKLVQAKAVVHVCKPCAEKRLISPDDFIPIAKLSSGSDLVGLIADPSFKVLTF